MNKLSFQIGLVVVSCLLVLSFPLYTAFWIYPHFTKIITFEKEVNAKQIARHITKMLAHNKTSGTLARESITDSFIAILQEAKTDFDLTKVKVFSPTGEVLYSSDTKDIGVVNTNSYFTDIVAKGNTFSIVVRTDEKTMEQETSNKDVVETYIPLMRDQRFIGALEVYYDITYAEHNFGIFITKARIIYAILTISLLICLLILTITIARNRKQLRTAEEKMAKIKEAIPPLYKDSLDEID